MVAAAPGSRTLLTVSCSVQITLSALSLNLILLSPLALKLDSHWVAQASDSGPSASRVLGLQVCQVSYDSY